MKLAPITFFVYNRPEHTRQTLEALSKNELANESELYVFADGPKDDSKAIYIEEKLDRLLGETISKEKVPKTFTFQKSMSDNRKYLFQFLYNKNVPPDNNGSERGVRNFKVKQKISGQFKSVYDAYAKLRSIIDTSIKKKIPVLDSLRLAAQISVIDSG